MNWEVRSSLFSPNILQRITFQKKSSFYAPKNLFGAVTKLIISLVISCIFFPGIIYQHPDAVLILSTLIDSNCYAIFFSSCRMSLRQRAERARLNMVSRLGRAVWQNVLHQMRVCPSKYPSECARDISSSGAKPFSSPCHFYGCRIMLKANICTPRHFKLNQEI